MSMIEVKTDELSGAALDWAVAKVEGYDLMKHPFRRAFIDGVGHVDYRPSTDWSQGGPLIEEYRVAIDYRALSKTWDAYCSGWMNGCETPLIAACRAIVAARLGDTVQVPAELLQ